MSDIEWTDATWNPVVGCSRVSEGCSKCYAMGVAHRKMSPQHVGLTKLRPKTASRPGIDWTGEVRFLPERLADPLHWRKSRRVFVNSMSDLFHERVTDEQIAAVFGVMAACPQHTFQVLTKRPERAVRWFSWAIHATAHELAGDLDHARAVEHAISLRWRRDDAWPLPNVHLGTSVEDQTTADERIPLLLQCPAAVRWVSYEPALGPVDFTRIGEWRGEPLSALCEIVGHVERPALDWIVVGGESGPGARPFNLAWARRVIADCHAIAGGPRVFVKQVGRVPYDYKPHAKIIDRKGGDMAEWPEDLRVREWPR